MKKIYERITLSLIIFSIIIFSVETLPTIEENIQVLLRWIEWFIVAIFTLEYLIRIATTSKKTAYIFSFFGLIDLLAILPLYLFTDVDLITVRIFRLFRLLKILRYNKSIRRFTRALTLIKEDMILFSIVATMLIYLAAVGIYYFEHEAQPESFKSVFHSLWWAVATLTTVGYGDIYPITVGGKIFTFFILMVGLGIISVPAGLLASALSRTVKDE